MRIHACRWLAMIMMVVVSGMSAVPDSAAQGETGTPMANPEAIDTPRFVIHPVGNYTNRWFEVTGEAGNSVTLTAGILNSGDIPASLQTYATNAFNPPNGGFQASPEDEAPTGATLWIDYPTTTFDMQPGDEMKVAFTLTVPSGTPPGEYVTALAVQTADALEIPGSSTFRQILRNTVSVEITVPGQMTSGFELGVPAVLASDATLLVEIPVINTGTARIRPQGDLVLTSIDGNEASRTHVEMGSVYGGNTSSILIPLLEQMPTGDYVLNLSLTDEASGATASIDSAEIEVPEAVDPTGVSLTDASIDPNAADIAFANVNVTLNNGGQVIPASKVSLEVLHDGELVESFPLATNQVLLSGENALTARYIPAEMWESGTYTFRLVVSAVDPNGGQETILLTEDLEPTITVP